jgi:Domain of unknown function (DUF4167)
MRNGQNNKRMRGRNNNNNNNHRKNHNPMARVFESNGPDVKIRGNPAHIAEKYMQLARDAQSSGDPVAAENYYQHAEHYYRVIATAQEQFRQNNPHFTRPDNEIPNGARDDFDESEDDAQPGMGGQGMGGQGMGGQGMGGQGGDSPYGTREPQPYLPRDATPYPQHQQPAPRPHQNAHPQNAHPPASAEGDVDRLPSFITGGQQPQHQPPAAQGNGHDNQGDRFPLHRRRRRHRGPRSDAQGGGDGGDESAQHGE